MDTAEQQYGQQAADLIAELRKHVASRDRTIDRLRAERDEAKRQAAWYLEERNTALAERDDAIRDQQHEQEEQDHG